MRIMRTDARMAKKSAERSGKATNLYLPEDLKICAKDAAMRRHGISLSALVEKLLEREVSLQSKRADRERIRRMVSKV